MHESQLIAAARTVLGPGTDVLAAGIMGLQETQYAAAAAAVASGAALDALPHGADPLEHAAGAAVAVHTARQVDAAAHGLTVRMLVAVTADRIHVLDWQDHDGPTRSLASFDRATAAVAVRKFGLSRTVSLTDPASGEHLELSASTAFFSPEAEGDKLVLHLLAG